MSSLAGSLPHPRLPRRLPREYIARVFALADERDRWMRRLAEAERDGFERGRQVGRREGAEQTLAALEDHGRYAGDRRWAWTPQPSYMRLTIRRYAPRGFRGRIPAEIRADSYRLRVWLANLPRENEYTGGPVQWT